jgi:hypothetical protein
MVTMATEVGMVPKRKCAGHSQQQKQEIGPTFVQSPLSMISRFYTCYSLVHILKTLHTTLDINKVYRQQVFFT